jgi:starch-binding outer membrane protein, SusD/RagB family
MKTKYLKIFFTSLVAVIFAISSCVNDLNTVPIDPLVVTSASVYKDANAYKQVLAKCYAGLAVSGQQGPDGRPDISGIDEGFSQYLRQYWYHQELTTDEAVIGWNDGTLKDFHFQTWTSGGEFIKSMYNRMFYQISLCNEFIRESSDAKLSSRGITGADKTLVETYRAEARFLRALSYYHAIDLFGNVPFVTETDAVGSFFPEQISRANLFNYIESELIAIEPLLIDPKTVYGRADKAAAWMLLANLYLNAEVYIGTPKYTECLTWIKKVTESTAYSLQPNYAHLFLADNNLSTEIIFPITFDGVKTKTWGGTTFIINAAVGGDMVPADFGISSGWGGTRTTPQFVDKFPDPTGATDKRAMFQSAGQAKSISDIFYFKDGYGIRKWKNITSTGAAGSNGTHADTDFPVYRLADAYLIYAEAHLRGGTGGDLTTALGYVNAVITRAWGGVTTGNITAGQLTLDFLIDERARELYGECHRRTDLIRFGKFSTSTYVWEWKGGVKAGLSTDSHFNIFPIPASDKGANPKLKQNDGY